MKLKLTWNVCDAIFKLRIKYVLIKNGGIMERKINRKQTFLAGVLTIAIAQIVIKFFGLFYRLVITNIPYFGDEGNGIYGAGFQIYTLLLAIVTTGIPIAV